MDGFTGCASAAHEVMSAVCTVMDPFQVVHLAAEKLTGCRSGYSGNSPAGREKKTDPLYTSRKPLHTRIGYLTPKQRARLDAFRQADELMVIVLVTWLIYQDVIATYERPTKAKGNTLMEKETDSIRQGCSR